VQQGSRPQMVERSTNGSTYPPQDSSTSEPAAEQKVNIKELLGAWEWLKAIDNRVKIPPTAAPSQEASSQANSNTDHAPMPAESKPEVSRPAISGLITFYEWLQENSLSRGAGSPSENPKSLR
jgi:hypothetical protein